MEYVWPHGQQQIGWTWTELVFTSTAHLKQTCSGFRIAWYDSSSILNTHFHMKGQLRMRVGQPKCSAVSERVFPC